MSSRGEDAAAEASALPAPVTSRLPLPPLDWGTPALEVTAAWPPRIQVPHSSVTF